MYQFSHDLHPQNIILHTAYTYSSSLKQFNNYKLQLLLLSYYMCKPIIILNITYTLFYKINKFSHTGT